MLTFTRATRTFSLSAGGRLTCYTIASMSHTAGHARHESTLLQIQTQAACGHRVLLAALHVPVLHLYMVCLVEHGAQYMAAKSPSCRMRMLCIAALQLRSTAPCSQHATATQAARHTPSRMSCIQVCMLQLVTSTAKVLHAHTAEGHIIKCISWANSSDSHMHAHVLLIAQNACNSHGYAVLYG